MIKSNLIYQIYTLPLTSKINKLKEENKEYKLSLDNLFINIKNNKSILSKYCKISLKEIKKLTEKDLKRINYPDVAIYEDGLEINFTSLKFYITNYVKLHDKYKFNKEFILKLQKQLVSYTIFITILKKFNTKVSEQIIYKGYEFCINKLFGTIRIVKRVTNKKRVNWGASHKKKAEIIAKGGIPYNKKDSEIEGYKGEFWLQHHPTTDFFFEWVRFHYTKGYNNVLKGFKYNPARQGSSKSISIMKKFSDFKQDRVLAFKTYDTK